MIYVIPFSPTIRVISDVLLFFLIWSSFTVTEVIESSLTVLLLEYLRSFIPVFPSVNICNLAFESFQITNVRSHFPIKNGKTDI